MKKWIPAFWVIFLLSCNENSEQTREVLIIDSLPKLNTHLLKDTIIKTGIPVMGEGSVIGNTRNKKRRLLPYALFTNTGTTTPDELMKFAETLIGVPYLWASADAKKGFDCSGFITYVFTHFKIQVPRSSVDFINVGKTVSVKEAKRGDFILFTGTDISEAAIGHMGLIVSNDKEGIKFIHATSGKAMSVTITKLNGQYKKRFVRISRIFRQNE